MDAVAASIVGGSSALSGAEGDVAVWGGAVWRGGSAGSRRSWRRPRLPRTRSLPTLLAYGIVLYVWCICLRHCAVLCVVSACAITSAICLGYLPAYPTGLPYRPTLPAYPTCLRDLHGTEARGGEQEVAELKRALASTADLRRQHVPFFFCNTCERENRRRVTHVVWWGGEGQAEEWKGEMGRGEERRRELEKELAWERGRLQ
eukprot:3558208-Rhodomonas_salina.1